MSKGTWRIVALAALTASAATAAAVSVPGLVTIAGAQPSAPPAWALWERHLIRAMNEAAVEFVDKYAERGGRMPLIGKPDDMYEVFANWPLFYALGGDDRIFDLSLRQWNAITRQLEAIGRVKRDFVVGYDWFHHSEGYRFFYYFGLADPAIPENVERARRFAAMYTGEDSDAPNYDPRYRIMRSPLTGATGPVFEQDCVYLLNHGHASLHPLLGAVEPGWEKNAAQRERLQQLYNRVVLHGDTPISLSATALVANAYLYTGEEKYRTWISEYAGAWMKRIEENHGIIPDNVGPTGRIGEERNGQWWGGLFGWSARYSLHMLLGAMTNASEVTHLVTADPKYLGLVRSQLDVLFRNSRTADGQLVFPYRYGKHGWFDYRPLEVRELSHLWNVSMDAGDWKRIEMLLAGYRYGPRPYDNYNDYAMPVTGHQTYRWKSNAKPMDWTRTVSNGDIGDKMQEQEELNEAPRLLYLAGRNPEFPENILRANYQEVLRRLEVSRGVKDIDKVPGLHSEYLAGINPVVTQGLVYLTLGGPQATYNGGLLQVRLRYFDLDRARPGLPLGVAALVEKLEPASTVVRLANVSTVSARRVLLQAGAFGEHEFAEVKDAAGKTTLLNARYFAVEMPASSAIRLEIRMRRFVHKPTYAFPWHTGK
ncbi:MAG: hypothetical protein ACKV22_01765 [Bryobacteraceae bacterium]